MHFVANDKCDLCWCWVVKNCLSLPEFLRSVACLCIAACVGSSCICTTTLLLVSCLPVLRNCHPAVTEHDFVVKIYHSKSTWSDDFSWDFPCFLAETKGQSHANRKFRTTESVHLQDGQHSKTIQMIFKLMDILSATSSGFKKIGSLGECFSRKWWFPQCIAKTSWVLNVPSSPK